MKNTFKIIILTAIIFIGINELVYADTKIKPGYHISKEFNLIPNDIKTNKKVILITIDDGPTKYTKGMIDVLDKHNIKAIFFINGTHNKDAPNTISEIYQRGQTIGNHTWSHLNLKKISEEKTKKEIESNSELIKKITGQNPLFFRAPFGVSTPYARNLVKKDNMIFMNWSGAALDWDKKTKKKEVFMQNVLKDLHPGEILLLHEHPWTLEFLDELLTTIESKGYTFANPKDITN